MLSTIEYILYDFYNVSINLSQYSVILSVIVILPLCLFILIFKQLIHRVFCICIALCLFLTNAPYVILYFVIPLVMIFSVNTNKYLFLKIILYLIFIPVPFLFIFPFSPSNAGVIKALYYDLILFFAYGYFIYLFISNKFIDQS